MVKLRDEFGKAAEEAVKLVLPEFNEFRSDEQEELLYRFMDNDDMRPLTGILPTNSGKSLVYQAGSWFVNKKYDGKTIVISPLISLMLDQVVGKVENIEKELIKQLKQGIICFNSNTTQYEDYTAKAKEAFKNEKYHLLYVAPERFRVKWFLDGYKKHNIMRFVIDEMHCVSLWGESFRYEYKNLQAVIKLHKNMKLVLLTASAGKSLVNKTLEMLVPDKKGEVIVIQKDIVRNEITILPPQKVDSNEERLKVIRKQIIKWLKKFEKEHNKKAKILIFSAFANEKNADNCSCEKIRDYLRDLVSKGEIALKKTQIEMYHGQLPIKERENIQNKFASGKVRILICTNAFGMGIDIKNICGVIHAYSPVTVEEYYQEIGRGGRDGKCETLLIWSDDDERALRFKIKTPWDFRIFVKFNLLAKGVLLVNEHWEEKYGLDCSIKSKKTLEYIEQESGMVREGNRPKSLTGAGVGKDYNKDYCYKLPDKIGTAKKICQFINNNWDDPIATKDTRRIFYWLNLYCEQKRKDGEFTLPPAEYSSRYKPKNSFMATLAYMVDEGWIERESTNAKGGIAKYRVAYSNLDDEQIDAFFAKMEDQRQQRETAWKKMIKLREKQTHEETWDYLKKNL